MSQDIGNYKIIRKIGSGSFGEVFLAEDKFNGFQVAVKKELKSSTQPLLRFESQVLKYLQGGLGIPKHRWFGTHGNYDILVMDLLGPSIEQLFDYCSRKLSLKTILMVALQLIRVIEYIHHKNIIHRDIKPDNILFGLERCKNAIYLIDFGLSKKYRDLKMQIHIPFRSGKSILGTARYCSINTHMNYEQSRRDDMESIAYILIYLQKGSLPWQNIHAVKSEKYRLIGEKKRATTEEELCQGIPEEFASYLKSVKALKFEEAPRYSEYHCMFKQLFERHRFKLDHNFDWNVINNKQKNR